MSPYIIVASILFVLSIYEFINGNTPKFGYAISIGILSIMLVFRYGQGTDYFGYYWIYTKISPEINLSQLMDSSIHTEAGWKFVCVIFKMLGASFEMLVVVVSIIEMFLLNKFVNKYCRYKIFSLLLSYHTLYLTYLFSALRQGLVICVFLGVLYDWYAEKKYLHYVIGVLLCTTLHTSAIVLLLIFLLKCRKLNNLKTIEWLIIFAWGAGIVLATGIFNFALQKILPNSVMVYFSNNTVSIALLERICSYVFVTIIYVKYLKNKKCERISYVSDFMKLYSIGIFLYGATIWVPLVSSRFTFYFKVLEIAIVSSTLAECKKIREIIFAYFLALSLVMFVKNVGNYIYEGDYFDGVTVLNYPYVSMIEKNEIFNYREISYKIE